MKKVCVFAGSSPGVDADHAAISNQMGAMMAARGIGLVYGGGRIGLMGSIADGASNEGGFVHGIIPQFLETLEVAHQGVTELTITETMQERKTLMYEASDGFIALPGGFGTMEELMETITQRQLKIHNKPIVIFNHKGYWDGLISMFDASSRDGFVRPHQLNLFDVMESLDQIGDFLDLFAKEA
ncbi:MAG TPA: TIGR00730 family Rossman fold protein [Alphaproteobacteria bacterium]|jgi:uncharacterized protein (TIGR00730 family)|nr:TIGR00730 family Rossman fold protein [SAR116 cluster bacterium]OUW36450.1 MAG: Rossman fold protein, TIGR00730 family [Gammaproteobacteria bacterium TMED183]HCD48836.1 TIGR00730 family Rossman fold protein [Alphaproteobacteria bacterium]HCV62682.1 TIGR00730 family Rossman fold protein [Alphaproteobacteria bacterium]|tara:strand:+ start:284 stop:835 length:552 start_codon:yes stop_codon:yes gene_type:complete